MIRYPVPPQDVEADWPRWLREHEEPFDDAEMPHTRDRCTGWRLIVVWTILGLGCIGFWWALLVLTGVD